MAFDIELNKFAYGASSETGAVQQIIIARVTKVILNEFDINGKIDKDFAIFGGWSSVGAIRFNILYQATNTPGVNNNRLIALPLYPHMKVFPVVGELVHIIMGPSYRLNDSNGEQDFYYITPVNLWRTVHNNAFPNLEEYSSVVNDVSASYESTAAGEIDNEDSETPSFPYGQTFVDKGDIKSLLPFEGDVLFEGRWGQSIRFGSTVNQYKQFNNWSNSGENGNPITIIRNGQGPSFAKESWVPTVENLNNDPASIFLTSNQQVEINIEGYPLDSFKLGTRGTNTVDTTLPLTDIPASFTIIAGTKQDEEILSSLIAPSGIQQGEDLNTL
jgi:hypothetical protein